MNWQSAYFKFVCFYLLIKYWKRLWCSSSLCKQNLLWPCCKFNFPLSYQTPIQKWVSDHISLHVWMVVYVDICSTSLAAFPACFALFWTFFISISKQSQKDFSSHSITLLKCQDPLWWRPGDLRCTSTHYWGSECVGKVQWEQIEEARTVLLNGKLLGGMRCEGRVHGCLVRFFLLAGRHTSPVWMRMTWNVDGKAKVTVG